eukprot:3933155-Rhodomonas_salina.2
MPSPCNSEPASSATLLRVHPVSESVQVSQEPLSQLSLTLSQEALLFPEDHERALYRLGQKRQPLRDWPGAGPLKVTKLIPSDFVGDEDESEDVVLGSQVQGNLPLVMEVCLAGMVARPDAKP